MNRYTLTVSSGQINESVSVTGAYMKYGGNGNVRENTLAARVTAHFARAFAVTITDKKNIAAGIAAETLDWVSSASPSNTAPERLNVSVSAGAIAEAVDSSGDWLRSSEAHAIGQWMVDELDSIASLTTVTAINTVLDGVISASDWVTDTGNS